MRMEGLHSLQRATWPNRPMHSNAPVNSFERTSRCDASRFKRQTMATRVHQATRSACRNLQSITSPRQAHSFHCCKERSPGLALLPSRSSVSFGYVSSTSGCVFACQKPRHADQPNCVPSGARRRPECVSKFRKRHVAGRAAEPCLANVSSTTQECPFVYQLRICTDTSDGFWQRRLISIGSWSGAALVPDS